MSELKDLQLFGCPFLNKSTQKTTNNHPEKARPIKRQFSQEWSFNIKWVNEKYILHDHGQTSLKFHESL